MSNRIAVLAVVLGVVAWAAPPKGRPATEAELIDRGIAAVKKKDVKAAQALMWNAGDVTHVCPDLFAKLPEGAFEKKQAQRQADVAPKIAECHALLDLTKAKQLEVRRGAEPVKREDGCGIEKLPRITVVFELKGKRVELELDDPAKVDGLFGFLDNPRCKAVEVADAGR